MFKLFLERLEDIGKEEKLFYCSCKKENHLNDWYLLKKSI